MHINDKYFNWTVIGAPYSHKGKRVVLCRCECGTQRIQVVSRLPTGCSKSCGCLRHRMFGTPTYITWTQMKSRCNNPKHDAYYRYGGAGVTVCERWNKFVNFYIDMGERPNGHSLDRIDNTKGYSPDNCRWATRSQQERNTCRTKLNESIVRQLRSGELTVKEVVRLTGCGVSTAKHARDYESWVE